MKKYDAVIIGSGVYGLETAEFLIKRGRKITIVDTAPRPGIGMLDYRMGLIMPWLEKKGAPVLTNLKNIEITKKGVVVTTAEEMPVQEARELLDAMATRLDRQPELVVVNSVYPPAPRPAKNADDATRLWIRRRQVNEAELAHLKSAWKGPIAEVPIEPIDAGPTLVGVVGKHLAAALEEQ